MHFFSYRWRTETKKKSVYILEQEFDCEAVIGKTFQHSPYICDGEKRLHSVHTGMRCSCRRAKFSFFFLLDVDIAGKGLSRGAKFESEVKFRIHCPLSVDKKGAIDSDNCYFLMNCCLVDVSDAQNVKLKSNFRLGAPPPLTVDTIQKKEKNKRPFSTQNGL